MKYFILAPIQLFFMVICYLTNWFVVLFADENGELHGALRLWQTWDDTLDNKSFIKNSMPKFLQYDWDNYYKQSEVIDQYNRRRFTETIMRKFTTKDKIKRYFCRVAWLYRNCGYGFAYYLFGQIITPPVKLFIFNKKNYFVYEPNKNIFNIIWALKMESHIFGKLFWNVYLGWKINKDINYQHRAMIATRISFKIRNY